MWRIFPSLALFFPSVNHFSKCDLFSSASHLSKCDSLFKVWPIFPFVARFLLCHPLFSNCDTFFLLWPMFPVCLICDPLFKFLLCTWKAYKMILMIQEVFNRVEVKQWSESKSTLQRNTAESMPFVLQYLDTGTSLMTCSSKVRGQKLILFKRS